MGREIWKGFTGQQCIYQHSAGARAEAEAVDLHHRTWLGGCRLNSCKCASSSHIGWKKGCLSYRLLSKEIGEIQARAQL
ncbi:hypothetical protein P153DRAFT_13532 [Dothidotthia symphoricarpi CBS 119687]|uniref:Uncharacterized protein n=1 Tax=Dothidotthia symphoricarpi CBS 119687 TaxID=1392245 RepID=A0A6A6ATH6_9PLEO|nr:uncharacterized protein P153DRAFT_13532 [Dothidotthia symphoricarpi CBS 119687]KAF2134970.1 hypothetical protein P153DRAFT_13532 [Dothidotthia symphoricarpi CBS 119687]